MNTLIKKNEGRMLKSSNTQENIYKANLWKNVKKNKQLVFMSLPAIIFFIVFCYLPMPGLYLAFIKYNYRDGIFNSKFIGLENFEFLIQSGKLFMLTKNTVLYNFAFIIIGNALQVIFAILINELNGKFFKKVSQSLMFLPHFISFVLVGLFAYNILSYDYGLLNNVLNFLGMDPVKTYSNPELWPSIIVFTYIWKSTGYGTIIYSATIMSIDTEMLDAAKVDGANNWQRILHIIIPIIKPTFVILLLFSIGGILRGNFQLFYNLVGSGNSLLFETTDIIETFVFRSLMNNFNFSLGSAVSLYQSVFGFALIMFANYIFKKIDPDYGLF